MKKAFGILCILTALLLSCDAAKNGKPDPEQNDFDKIRLNHISYLFSTVQEYAAKKGAVPFAALSDTVPVVVLFETERQKEKHGGKYPIIVHLETRFPDADSIEKPQRVAIRTADTLYAELVAVLEREIAPVRDPRELPGKKPCLYILTVYKNVFDVTAFLCNPLPFTRKLAPGNNKVSLTSAKKSYPLVAVWTPGELLGKTIYKVFMKEPFTTPGLEKKLIR